MSSRRGSPLYSLTTAPAMVSSRCLGLATVTSWNFCSPLRNGDENFRQSLQSAMTSAVSVALPVTALPDDDSMALRT